MEICPSQFLKDRISVVGTSTCMPKIQPEIEAEIQKLPFKIKSFVPLASNGENHVRKVAVIKAEVETNSGSLREVVIKIGQYIDGTKSATEESAFQRGGHQKVVDSQLGSHVASCDYLVGGDVGSDVRVQDFIKGKPLNCLDLAALEVKDYDSLAQYHLTALRAILSNRVMVEPGYGFFAKTLKQRIINYILLGSPLASQNILMDSKDGKVKIVDAANPIAVASTNTLIRRSKIVFYSALMTLEFVALTMISVGLKIKDMLKQEVFEPAPVIE